MRNFANGLADHGDSVALIDPSNREITYAELADQVDDFAAKLGNARRLVAIEAALTVPSVVAYLAALRAGHATILTQGPPSKEIISAFHPELLIDAAGAIASSGAGVASLHPELALMMSTSGSTGSPKLVKLSQSALDANAKAIIQYLGITPAERAITTLPLGYSYGLSVLNSHLAIGASIILNDRSVIDQAFWAVVDEMRATSLAGVPYTYELLEQIQFRNADHPSLVTLTQAGGRLPPTLVRDYAEWAVKHGKRFFVMYGQTEATARMAYLPPHEAAEHSDCIGRAIPGAALRIDDGELVFTGPNVMMGYGLNREDLARGPELSELRTGDLAEQVGDLFRITGRASRFSKIVGLRVSLDDIEQTLADEGVNAVVAGDDTLIAIGVLEPATPERALAILQNRGRIPDWAYFAILLPEVPRLASGKTDYAAMLSTAKAGKAVVKTVSRNAGFADEYRRLLLRETVAPDDNFTSLAGDSLSYVQVSMAIEERLGELPTNWETLSVSQLDTLALESVANGQSSNFRSLSSEIIVRLCAVSAILIHHIGTNLGRFSVIGGALVLLMTAGYNLNRFQRERLLSSSRLSIVSSFFLRFLIPAYIVVLVFSVFGKNIHVGMPTLFLMGNWFYESRGPLGLLWFMEALFQCMLAVVLLFFIPIVRRKAGENRWRFAVLFFGAALVVMLAARTFYPEVRAVGVGVDRRPDAYIAVYALGWLLSEATTPKRKAGCLAIAYGLPAFGYGWADSHTVGLTLAMAAMLYLPRVRLWTPLAGVLGFLAGCTFYIYLSHSATIYVLYQILHVSNRPLAFVSCVAGGVVSALTWQWISARVAKVYFRLRLGRRPGQAHSV